MCDENPNIFSEIVDLNPKIIETATIITVKLNAIAIIAMRTIGFEIFVLFL